MENSAKVFSSNITRVENNHNNNLYDLLNVTPAEPLKIKDVKKYTCNYSPKTDKYYTSKRKSRLKVKTVRDIRKSFEQETYTYLFSELEIQQNNLFKKIRLGTSNDDSTRCLAKKILRGENPISRTTWQMLINLNPEHHTHPRQFALWNGKYIQVNGSYGGRNKLICNYDLGCKIIQPQNNKKKNVKTNINPLKKKKGLLRDSLAVKFKPGPLAKKQILDDSYQKYHVGNIELVDLPKLGLDIQPTYGTALESTIINFLINMREEDGTISQKWAELAVSVLGKNENSNAVQSNRDCVTFDLQYKYNQNRLLMRHDVDNHLNASNLYESNTVKRNTESLELPVQPEIVDILNKVIDSVEINIIQDKLFTQEQDVEQIAHTDLNSLNTIAHIKDKTKRRFCELDRLDVTVIRLPESKERLLTRTCSKLHCSLGCICDSLERTHNLKQHCGRVECMFDCKCDFSKYKSDLSSVDCSDLIPGLINLDHEINEKLSKEEQKFHQTVIVAGEKRILLKGEKRNLKTPKKYADFFSNISLKNENKAKKVLSIVALKFNCDNIQPWCMVHKLYKCFCKGKFTEPCTSGSNNPIVKESSCKDEMNDCSEIISKQRNEDTNTEFSAVHTITEEPANLVKKRKIFDNSDNNPEKIDFTSKSLNKPSASSSTKESSNYRRTRHSLRKFNMTNTEQNSYRDMDEILNHKSDPNGSDNSDFINDQDVTYCSRTSAYEGRKYSNGYYKNTNTKILEMEKNDKRLQQRLLMINNNSSQQKNVIKPTVKSTNDTTSLLELLCDDVNEIFPGQKSDDGMVTKSKKKRLSSETKLVAWLESNYKIYKQQTDKGTFKKSLEPPTPGKMVLHSWDFILKRYRERKNLFLVSQQKPFRIFMAVDIRNAFFENCININFIRFADLHKYPQTVKNLLINATDLKDNFCILRGLNHCWELIGSVTKVNESEEHSGEHEDTPEINVDLSNSDALIMFDQNDQRINDIAEFDNKTALSEDAGSSKWFVMTIENDFTEIRFFRRGFFVKYECIINAINVARVSGKTVRLSSKKNMDEREIPQFGVYAIPNDNEYCVFVGPYEMEDTLGIETIKTMLDVRKIKRTRGFWITTNKIDNLKVVENPLSFVPSTHHQIKNAMPLDTHFSINDHINTNHQENTESVIANKTEELKEPSSSKPGIKVVKPIKIRKTNGFYHLASDGVLKKIYPQSITKAAPLFSTNKNVGMSVDAGTVDLTETPPDPPAEPPQIKISAVFSAQTDDFLTKSPKREKGMLILKPEEINRRLLQSKQNADGAFMNTTRTSFDDGTEDISCLIESELECSTKSPEWPVPKDDIYVISDDENDTNCESTNDIKTWRDVFIECTNVSKLGWIAGLRSADNLLSYKFPGCEFSNFYADEEVFTKINLELFKRIDSSMNLEPQWKVTESSDQVNGQEINHDHLYPDYMLTQEGLIHTSERIKSNKDHIKTYSKIQLKDRSIGSCSPRERSKITILVNNFKMPLTGAERAKRYREKKK